MKIRTHAAIVLLALFCNSMAMAQEVDIFGAIMEAAEAQENAGNQARLEADRAARSEAATAWEEAWEQANKDNAEILDALDTKYLKCTALMILYVDAYLKLVNEHKLGDTTLPPCDAYSMQALAMAASTTIIYCPEEMAQLSDEQLRPIIGGIRNAFGPVSENDHIILHKLNSIIDSYFDAVREQDAGDQSVYGGSPDTEIHVLKYLIEFFRPRYIIPRTIKIGQEMEAMGCSG